MGKALSFNYSICLYPVNWKQTNYILLPSAWLWSFTSTFSVRDA